MIPNRKYHGYIEGFMMKKKGAVVVLGCAIVFLLVNLLGCKMEPQMYSVTFNTNGGSAVTAQSVQEDDKATRPVDPTMARYTFGGWYTEDALTTVWDFGTQITKDTILYAKWLVTKEELKRMITAGEDVTEVDTSGITDMSVLFHSVKSFTGDISGWDVSNVTNMKAMFFDASSFNQDISGWDVSKVTNMQLMFYEVNSFNGDISGWKVGSVTDMSQMFNGCNVFNSNISGWDVSNVTDMRYMFSHTYAFNQNLSGWVVGKVTNKTGFSSGPSTVFITEHHPIGFPND